MIDNKVEKKTKFATFDGWQELWNDKIYGKLFRQVC